MTRCTSGQLLVSFGDLCHNAESRYLVRSMLFPPIENRRRSHRQWIAVPVRIRLNGSQVDGVTINLSENGMYAFAAANLAVGDTVQIVYRAPDKKKSVRTEGIVRRRAVYLYGIEFLHEHEDRAFMQTESQALQEADSTT